MRQSVVLKIWAAAFSLVMGVLLPLGLAANQTFTNYHYHLETRRLIDHGEAFAGILGESRTAAVMLLPMIARLAGAGVLLLDEQGQVVAREQLPTAAETALPPERLAEVRAGRVVSVRNIRLEGASYTAVAVPVPTPDGRNGGALLFLAPAGAASATLGALRRLLALAGVGAILLSTGLAFILSLTLARPLIRMEEATRAMARGHYDVRLPVWGADEVALLGNGINQLAAELDRYERSRREFLANVSHELRTPLSYLRGYSQELADGLVETPEDQARHHRIILEEAIRLGRLVDDLTDLAQMEEGRLKLKRAAVDVPAIARRVAEKLQPRGQAQGVALEPPARDPLPPAWADPGRVEQVLLNLLDNALQHTPAGGQVAVTAVQAGAVLRVTVRDTGRGIPLDELPHIWERFHKVDKSRTRREGGLGLGLAIVKSIVQAHGGEVGAESPAGGGAALWFTLPIVQGQGVPYGSV